MNIPLPLSMSQRWRGGGTYRLLSAVVLFTIVLRLLVIGGVQAQDPAEMPLLLVEGSTYVRQTYDVRGGRESQQEVVVSRLRRTGDQMEVQITLYKYDAAGQATDTLLTTIRCSEQDSEMILNVLALMQPEGRRVAVRVTGGDEVLYARRTAADDSLNDVNLEGKVEQGVLGFLGSRSRFHLQDRVVRAEAGAGFGAQPAPRGQPAPYTVSEVLHMEFSVLGIKVRERTYRAETMIDPARGLLRQILKAPDGSSITLERVG